MGGVGEGDHARLRFFFEVTFMQIDIAWVEAYLDPGGEILVDGTYEGRDAARGFVGSFMCREAALSEKLIRSAWDVPAR